jgi:hypothetical protein
MKKQVSVGVVFLAVVLTAASTAGVMFAILRGGEPRLVTREGEFHSRPGQEGEIGFGGVFGAPPTVDLGRTSEDTVITEIRPTGFRWKNTYNGPGSADRGVIIHWKANGVPE